MADSVSVTVEQHADAVELAWERLCAARETAQPLRRQPYRTAHIRALEKRIAELDPW